MPSTKCESGRVIKSINGSPEEQPIDYEILMLTNSIAKNVGNPACIFGGGREDASDKM